MFSKISSWIQSFKDKAKQDLSDIWNHDKAFFFLFGLVILFIKFRDIIIDVLINSAKRVQDNAQKKDTKLSGEEDVVNKQADDLVRKASEEPSKEQPVGDDWYKTEK